jgi:hypothetical protein
MRIRRIRVVKTLGSTDGMSVNARFLGSVSFPTGTVHLFDCGEVS